MKEIKELIKEFSDLPRFEDGRIDYSSSNKAPVINCFLKYKDKVLILKRSEKVSAYKGKWNSIGGYLDEDKPIEEKIFEELREELSIGKDKIKTMIIKDCFEYYDEDIDRTWIIFPCLVELKKPIEIKLDWEHTDYEWIMPEEITNFDTLPNLPNILKILL